MLKKLRHSPSQLCRRRRRRHSQSTGPDAGSDFTAWYARIAAAQNGSNFSAAGAAAGGTNSTDNGTAAVAAAGAAVVALNGQTGTVSPPPVSSDNPDILSKGGHIVWVPPPSMGGWSGLVPQYLYLCRADFRTVARTHKA